MQLSWLLRCSLSIVVATRAASTYSHETSPSIEVAPADLGKNAPSKESVHHEGMAPGAIENQTEVESFLITITNPTSDAMEKGPQALRIPRPTAAPSLRKRQDDGQIQALSAQLQSLSQSATQAISSVSSSASSILSQMSQSAQSVQQSANQVAQSASQAADQASRQLSQTISSASSAVSAVNSRVSDQLSQSLASMSSRISSNQASAQSSASNAISSARVAASQFAASQIQAAKVGATGVTGDTNPQVNQTPSNSVSVTNLAIITTVSIVGTAILSTISSCLFLRYRRRKRSSRIEEALSGDGKRYEKPIAVRGSVSPRFPRFGGSSRSPMNEFRLPSLSPPKQSKKAQREGNNNIGSAVSDYGDQAESRSATQSSRDMNDNQRQNFRLQKDNGLSSATTVRLIRVGSEKSKADSPARIQQTATEPIPPPPAITTLDQSPKITPNPNPNQSTTQPPPQTNTIITEPSKPKGMPSGQQRVSVRSARNSDTETPGWRPPTLSTEMTRDRFRFRDSSDMESAEPTPTNLDITSLPQNPNTSSSRAQRPATLQAQTNYGSSGFDRTASTTRPKNGRGTFATFPRIRNEQERESMMNRGRPNRNGRASRLRVEDETR
ncbi:hypothetical protein F5Y09DRAFT_119960 [Xylaria sp. FL1042]|nr:hypothetical protein F5Y09DRAFT_119960 [Xylaria sp. FL1042]